MNNLKRFLAIPVMAVLSGCVGRDGGAMSPASPGIANESATPPAVQVSIDNFTFKPDVVTIAPGGKVVWTNRDDVPHTVKADGGQFTSAALDTDDAFTHVFAARGEYEYFCSIHPHMVGRVVVK